jgi:hypothetical protein
MWSMAEPADDAGDMVASVRDDPAARLALAAGFYDTPVGNPRIRPYRRAEVAFMRWQIRRGVLAADRRPCRRRALSGGSRPWPQP